MIVKPIKSINKSINVIGDKSITHRSLMLSAISDGKCIISNAGMCQDTVATINCLRALGANISVDGTTVTVLPIVKANDNVILDCGNSGTTARLLSGLVCGLNINAKLTGDASLYKRPMRTVTPLRQMQADISFGDDCILDIKPSKLIGIEYNMPVASAQIKSGIMLAALFANGKTIINEKLQSRNHTELLFKEFNADYSVNSYQKEESCYSITVNKCKLKACDTTVPADISQASYFIALAAMLNDSCVILNGVNINPTRTGLLQLLIDSGLNCQITNKRTISGELVADLVVKTSLLSPLNICAESVPSLIDEIPIAAVIAANINGISTFNGIGELRHKESDRINSVCKMLQALECKYSLSDDNLTIYGKGYIKSGSINVFNDHRIAMCGVIAGLVSQNGVEIDNVDCISVSYPQFIDEIKKL